MTSALPGPWWLVFTSHTTLGIIPIVGRIFCLALKLLGLQHIGMTSSGFEIECLLMLV